MLRQKIDNLLRLAILGPAYIYHRYLIQRSKAWSEKKIAYYQKKHARKAFSVYGEEIKNKQTYLQNPGKFSAFDYAFLTKTMRTGGTTGTPFIFKMDRFFRRQKERAYIFEIWQKTGFKPFDTRVVFRGNIGTQLLRYNWFENAWEISPNCINKDNIQELYDKLLTLGSFFLHVYPSSLFTFVELFGDESFKQLNIKGVLAGSESFPLAQMESFQAQFDIPIAHWYGHSEYAVLADFCSKCKGYHFFPTYGFTEFVAEDGDTQSENKRIIATSYNSIGTKFVRYDTGDLAVLAQGQCDEPFLSVAAIQGRTQDFFIGKDGKRYAFGPYLFGIHNQFWEQLSQVQFIQHRAGELEVKLVLHPKSDETWIKHFLCERFSVLSLDFITVDDIPKTAAGKHRYFINKLG